MVLKIGPDRPFGPVLTTNITLVQGHAEHSGWPGLAYLQDDGISRPCRTIIITAPFILFAPIAYE